METKEQLQKRIAELEEELQNSKFETDNYESKYTKLMETKQKIENRLVKCGKRLRQQEEENAKLQEQLKNAIVPKYHLDQYVYVIRWEKPYLTRIDVIKAILINGKVEIFYEYDFPGSYSHVEIIEDGVFATEAEAQKYLEEHNGKV